MLLREVEPRTRPLLYAVAIGAFSVLASMALTAGFASLVACRRAPAATLSNFTHCTGNPTRPAVHCPDLQLLVYRDCQWRCE